MARKLLLGIFLQASPSYAATGLNIDAVPQALIDFGGSLKYEETHCPGARLKGGVESDFANHPHLKLLAYDLYDGRSWSVLNGLQTCLESATLTGCSKNVWEGQKSAYAVLEATRGDVTQWPKQAEYIEYDLLAAKETVLTLDKASTAPMSEVSENFILQQPCNTLSNAAYYEIALDSCAAEKFPDLPDWTWKDELIAAASGMAFGSFAMHGGASGGQVPSGKYNTNDHDVIAMNQLFYILHQGLVRNLAVNSADPSLSVILNFGGYPDAKVAVQAWAKLLESDGAYWDANQKAVLATTPNYLESVVGIILVFIRTMLHPELFGAASDVAFEIVCGALVDMMLPDASAKKALVCAQTSDFAKAIFGTNWKVVKDLGIGFGYLGELMELFVEAFYWQETKAKPTDYLKPWIDNSTITENSRKCWQQPHANWHRIAAQLVRGMLQLVIRELPVMMLTPPLTQEQKQAAWADPLSAASKFVYTLRTKIVMSQADTINLCTIFARTALGGGMKGGLPLEEPQNLMDEQELNQFITSTLADLDPWLDITNGTTEFNALDCKYELEYRVTEVHGLSCLQPVVDIEDMEYSESNASNPIITATAHFNMPAEEIMARAKFDVIRPQNCDPFKKDNHPGKAEARIKIGIDIKAKVVVNLAQMFADLGEAITVTIPKFELDCQKLHLPVFDIKNFFGEGIVIGIANTALMTPLRQVLCDKIEEEVVKEAESAINKEITKAGSRMPTSGRRLFEAGRSFITEMESTRNAARRLQNMVAGEAPNFGVGSRLRRESDILDKPWLCKKRVNLLAEGMVASTAPSWKLHFLSLIILSFVGLLRVMP